MKTKVLAPLLGLALGLVPSARADWAPSSFDGLKAIVVITGGSGYFASNGGYRLTVSNATASIIPLTATVDNQTFTYAYVKIDATHGMAVATEIATGGVVFEKLHFTSPTSADIALIAFNPGTGARTGTPSVNLSSTISGNTALISYTDSITNFQAAGTLDLLTDAASVITSAGASIGTQNGTLMGDGSFNHFVNLSTRGAVGTGNDVLIAGLVIAGPTPKQVLIRAAGPSLTTVGISEDQALADPVLALHHSYNNVDTVIATNDNWSSAEIGTAFTQTGAFAWTPGSKDAALLMTLEPGSYTAIVTGKNATSGIALVEVYEMP